MSFRIVCITKPCKLEFAQNHLIINDVDKNKVLLKEIAVLVVENTMVSLSAYLLAALSEEKIALIICDEKHLPTAFLQPFYANTRTSLRLNEQINFKYEIKEAIWQNIVANKLNMQAKLLVYLGALKPASKIKAYIKEIKGLDDTNKEAHAAKIYFNALLGKDFSRDKDNNINAALNYGYAILLAAFSREIVMNGYDTRLGIFHKSQFNHFNLACDFMESFRPLVDIEVITLEGLQKLVLFDQEAKHTILQVLNVQVLIDDKKQYLLNAISIYVRSIFKALSENDISLIKVYEYEL